MSTRGKPTKLFVFLAVVTLIALALAGCGETTTTTAAGGGGGETVTTEAPSGTGTATVFKFAESNPIASNQHQMAFNYGKRMMCDVVGAEFITADANITPAKQVADIETFIQQKVDGISSWTLDQGAATAVYKRAQDAGIPVVTENSPGDYVTTVFVQEQNVTRMAQTDAAKWFNSVYPGGKVFVVGGEPVPYILYVARNMELEAEAVGLDVLARQDNMTDTASGAQVIVADLLTKYPDVQAVWCFNDPSALGASAALRAADKKIYDAAKPEAGAVLVTGMNGTQEGIEAVRAGIISATYSGDSELVGAAQIELLYRIASGEMKADAVPSIIVCPYHRIDGTNAAEASFPLQTKIEKGILDKFIAHGTDPATIDDFLAFLKTL